MDLHDCTFAETETMRETFVEDTLWSSPRDVPVKLSIFIVKFEVPRVQSPPPRESEHNAAVSAVRWMGDCEFFDRAIESLGAAYVPRVTSRSAYPCALILSLLDNEAVVSKKPHLDFDHVRLAGVCALCGYATTHKRNVKAVDCNRCVNHVECAEYMVRRAGWPALYCVTRGFGQQHNTLKIECANREKPKPLPGPEEDALEIKRVLKIIAQRLMKPHASPVEVEILNENVLRYVTDALRRRYSTTQVSSNPLKISVTRAVLRGNRP